MGAAVLAGPREAILQLRDCRGVFQAPVGVEERPDEIQPADAGRAFEIERRSRRARYSAASGRPLARQLLTIRQLPPPSASMRAPRASRTSISGCSTPAALG